MIAESTIIAAVLLDVCTTEDDEFLEAGEPRATSPFGVAVFLPCGVTARVDALL